MCITRYLIRDKNTDKLKLHRSFNSETGHPAIQHSEMKIKWSRAFGFITIFSYDILPA